MKNEIFNEEDLKSIVENLNECFNKEYGQAYILEIYNAGQHINISIKSKNFDDGFGWQSNHQIVTLDIDNQDNKSVCDAIKEGKDLIKKSVDELEKVSFYDDLIKDLNKRKLLVLDKIKEQISDSYMPEKSLDEELVHLSNMIQDIDKKYLSRWSV